MTPAPPFQLGRFLLRAVPWAVAAGVAWKLTAGSNAVFTIWLTKLLHRAAGFPGPYLYCDETRLFWHSTMFPPVVALTLASHWLAWPGRILRAAAGYVAHCGMTAVAITINESPYLQRVELLDAVTSTLVNANYLMLGVVIWILAAGPWYRRRDDVPATHGWWRRIRNGWATRIVLLWAGVALVIPLFAMLGSKSGMSARLEVAAAMRAVPFFPQPSSANLAVSAEEQFERDRLAANALKAIQSAIEDDDADGLASGALWHLAGNLFNSLRPQDPQLAAQFKSQAAMALIKAANVRGR